MIFKTANDAAIRIAHLKQAVATMPTLHTESSEYIVASLEEEIEFLLKEIQSAFEAQRHPDNSIAQPIAPNI